MKIQRKMAATVAGLSMLGLTTLVGTAPAAQAVGGTVHGCPHGAVCLYPQDKGWNADRPSYVYWSYGAHNLSGQYGNHYVLNNQYDACSGCGWAEASLFSGYNATGTELRRLAPWDHQPYQGRSWDNINLTPVNSINMWVVGP